MYANANHLSDNELELENLMLCQSITECIIDSYNLTGSCICTECGHVFENINLQNIESMHYTVLRHIQDHYRLLGVRQPEAPAPIAQPAAGAVAQQAVGLAHDDDDLPQLEQPRRQPFVLIQQPVFNRLRENMLMEPLMRQNMQQIMAGFDMMVASINGMGGNMIIIRDLAGNGIDGDYGDDDDDDGGGNAVAREYRYHCHVCNRGYNSEIRLNNHFMRNHNNFDGLNILDKKALNGFPGFDVLQKIKMIRYIQAHEKMDDNTCCICCKTYDKKMYNKTDDDVYVKDKQKHLYKNNTDDHKILYLNKIDTIKRMPIQLKCCKAIFCTECLYNHIVSKYGEPECPFCMKNHNLVGKRFVIFDERPPEKIALNPNPYPIRYLGLE
jgi:hypothetical protein